MNFDFTVYAGCVLGIVVSVLLPPLWAIVREKFRPVQPGAQPKGMAAAIATGREVLAPYAALGVASALTALLLVAFLGDKLTSVNAAILAGYAWDSTLQKLK